MLFRVMFAIVIAGKSALCKLPLNISENVKGVRSRSVVIPCTYTPSSEYTEDEVLWSHEKGLIFKRFNSEDHILLADYRDKISVSKSPPGDVSLTITKLRPFYSGKYTCTVKWRQLNSRSRIVTMEGITDLTLGEAPPSTEKAKEKITAETTTRFVTTPFAAEKPKEEITAKTRTIFVTSSPATEKSIENITSKTRTIFVTTPNATEKPKERTTANSRTNLVTTPFAAEKPKEEITAKTRTIFVTSSPATEKSIENITSKTRTIFVTTPNATEKPKERTTANSRTNLVTTHAASKRPKEKITTETGPSTLIKNSSSTRITQLSPSSTWKNKSYSAPFKNADKLFGSAIPIYILIFGLGSILAILIPTVVLISKRKKRKGYSTVVQK
uniref:Ig-like domain-containing protein n=1 Tax=Leptobrachium leishanense TaxID=445787 RepID=A0A8C5WF13_9ANUR